LKGWPPALDGDSRSSPIGFPASRRRSRAWLYLQWLAFVGVFAVTAVVLDAMGRSWLCPGYQPWRIWSGNLASWHGSQHLLDPYSATHVLHGLVFFAGAWLLLGRWLSLRGRWWAAFSLEAVWEVVENTPFVIERYREATLALGYAGDSIINSLGDMASFVVGFALAAVLPASFSVVLFFLVEGVLLLTIRDSLVLNVVMLFCPLETLKVWQMGGRF